MSLFLPDNIKSICFVNTDWGIIHSKDTSEKKPAFISNTNKLEHNVFMCYVCTNYKLRCLT